MSQIDVYKHECLGMIRCGRDWNGKYLNSMWWIPIYRLLEDAEAFDAEKGDVLVGGGSGETAELLIRMPEALRFTTMADDLPDRRVADEPVEVNWSPTAAYSFGRGYVEEGWDGEGGMEWFVADHVLAFLLKEYPPYSQHAGPEPLDRDGSICRLPYEEERELYKSIPELNWRLNPCTNVSRTGHARSCNWPTRKPSGSITSA